MKYPSTRFQTEEDKYLAAIAEHTEEAQKYEGYAAQCHNPRIKRDYQHSAASSWEAAKREQRNLDQYRERERARRAGQPVQASMFGEAA